jgi:hypothetical protein
MSNITYKTEIDKFRNDLVEVDGNNVTKKLVGFKITRDNGATLDLFIIDKWIDIVDGKADDTYASEAYTASLTEINEWKDSFAHVGQTFNPDTGKME